MTDWEALGRKLGTITPDGESANADSTRRATALLVPADEWRHAVRWYVDRRRGAELARLVLNLVQPEDGLNECLGILRNDPSLARRRSAADLIRCFSDPKLIDVADEMLASGDEAIAAWGVSLAEAIGEANPGQSPAIEAFLRKAELHPSLHVRGIVAQAFAWLQIPR